MCHLMDHDSCSVAFRRGTLLACLFRAHHNLSTLLGVSCSTELLTLSIKFIVVLCADPGDGPLVVLDATEDALSHQLE